MRVSVHSMNSTHEHAQRITMMSYPHVGFVGQGFATARVIKEQSTLSDVYSLSTQLLQNITIVIQ